MIENKKEVNPEKRECGCGNTPEREERIKQYIDGLRKFFEYNDVLKKHNIDVYLVDNSIKDGVTLPPAILNIIPDNVTVNTSLNNNFRS